MCFNAPVSLTTFLIGIIGSFRLYILNYKPEAIFYAWVVLMQLIEFVLWRNQPCNKTNLFMTNLGMIVNHLEPIALWVGILLFSQKELPFLVNVLMIVFLVTTLYYTRLFLRKNKIKCTTETEESSPHLHWKWNYGPYYIPYYSLFLLCLFVLSVFGLNHGTINALLLVTSYLVSYVLYSDTKSVGAMWCFFAAFGPWLIPLLNDLV
jgi:hypothetical protein